MVQKKGEKKKRLPPSRFASADDARQEVTVLRRRWSNGSPALKASRWVLLVYAYVSLLAETGRDLPFSLRST